MAWVYLFMAALFEIGWTFCVKYLSFKKIISISWITFFKDRQGLLSLLPLAGYIFLGLGNIFFFSMAMKKIPASAALAVWMGISLTGVKLTDTFIFKEPFTLYQLFFFALILIGITGLKNNL